jgi:DNA primase small subunit
LKSEIVYEIDADDLRTDCKKTHDSWKCKCGEKGKGLLDNCPKCGERVEREEWVCAECLNATKKQLLELIEFIENDFGFTSGLSVNFSGAKGFHLHLSNEEVLGLSASARIELLDYLTANGLDLRFLGFVKEEKKLLCPSPLTAVGWPKRISSKLVELFKEGNAQKISAFSGASFKETEKILKEKEKIISMIEKGILFQSMPHAARFWNSLIESVLEEMRLRIDRQTSVDMAKLIRVPDTIHGGTGLLAKTVSIEELKEFEPLNEAIIFSSL